MRRMTGSAPASAPTSTAPRIGGGGGGGGGPASSTTTAVATSNVGRFGLPPRVGLLSAQIVRMTLAEKSILMKSPKPTSPDPDVPTFDVPALTWTFGRNVAPPSVLAVAKNWAVRSAGPALR